MTEKINYSAEEILNGKINKILDKHSVGTALMIGCFEGAVVILIGLLNLPAAACVGIGLAGSNVVDIVKSANKLKKLRKQQETASRVPGSGRYLKYK
jgi:hypothetical protein